jgi:hypothetical protein
MMRYAFAIFVLVGCGRPSPGLGGDATPGSDSAADAPVDVGVDASFDAPIDAAIPDAAIDASTTDASTGPCNTTFTNAEIFQGSITIAGPLDLQVLDGKRAITGTLTIATTMADVSLPNIEYVGLDLQLPFSGSVATVELPGLCHIGHDVWLAGFDLVSIDLQTVREIGGKFDVLGFKLTSLDMPSLLSIGGTWTIYSSLSTLSAPNLTDIAGSLLLEGTSGLPLSSLSGLRSLTNVRSILVANDPQLIDLRGLEHIRALPLGLSLSNDANLRSLTGLQLDPGPVGMLSLSQLPRLQNISPLSAVTSVDVVTQGIPLSNGWLVVVGTGLADLSPLSNIANVGSRAQIENNASLVHATLNTATAEFVFIDNNRSLVDVSFPNLAATRTMQLPKGTGLSLDTNAVLANISFPALTHVDGAGVIVGNPMLPTCQATNLAAQAPATDGWNITNNGTGTCPTASRRAPSGP